jgi:formylglycine-generating enzyme required for sulfatase activity
VTFASPFALGRYPVTFDEYDHFCIQTGLQNPHHEGWGRGRRPVINVSWIDAKEYCGWLSIETGKRYRLPSEAEWEYACRAGTNTSFWTGAMISTEQANFDGTNEGYEEGEFRKQTTPVDTFKANPWGLYDMHGNVGELVEDCWNHTYHGAPTDGSAWLQETDVLRKHSQYTRGWRTLRGGGWGHPEHVLRSASRDGFPPGERSRRLGFRVARALRA